MHYLRPTFGGIILRPKIVSHKNCISAAGDWNLDIGCR